VLATLRVRLGVRFLDWHLGRETWLPRVDVDEVAVIDADLCPLAQATGESYYDAVNLFNLRDDGAGSLRTGMLGFNVFPRENWQTLDVEWRRVIRALQRKQRERRASLVRAA
jgi:hypothetical protein